MLRQRAVPSALASGCAAFRLGFPTSCLRRYVGGAHGVKPKNIIARHHENLLDFCGAGEDNGGRGTDSPGGRHRTELTVPPPAQSPIFTLDALPAATLPIYPGLGQAPIYAGSHTRWLGSIDTHHIDT